MNIVICDDESVYVNSITCKVKQWATKFDRLAGVVTYSFSSSEDLLDEWEHGLVIDLLFLDIQIPGELSGMDLAKQIHSRNEHIPIVFITNYAEYACEGYLVNALRYLRKPVSYEVIEECMQIAWRRWQLQHDNCVVIKSSTQVLTLPAKSIIYIEVSNHSLYIHSTDKIESYIIRYKMEAIKDRLPDELFAQCHRSFIVNLMYVRRFANGEILMADETVLPIGRTYLKEFVDRFRKYYLGGEIE